LKLKISSGDGGGVGDGDGSEEMAVKAVKDEREKLPW
jgi:hypothetical protein